MLYNISSEPEESVSQAEAAAGPWPGRGGAREPGGAQRGLGNVVGLYSR